MMPQARLQPIAPINIACTSSRPISATLIAQVNDSTMMRPKTISEKRSSGSRTRLLDGRRLTGWRRFPFRGRFDDAERDAAFIELCFEGEKGARPRHVDHGRSRQIPDDQPDRLGCSVESRQDCVEDMLRVEINDAGFDAEGEEPGGGFVA